MAIRIEIYAWKEHKINMCHIYNWEPRKRSSIDFFSQGIGNTIAPHNTCRNSTLGYLQVATHHNFIEYKLKLPWSIFTIVDLSNRIGVTFHHKMHLKRFLEDSQCLDCNKDLSASFESLITTQPKNGKSS